MATVHTTTIRHMFHGGWATDFGPSVDILPEFSAKIGGVTGTVQIEDAHADGVAAAAAARTIYPPLYPL